MRIHCSVTIFLCPVLQFIGCDVTSERGLLSYFSLLLFPVHLVVQFLQSLLEKAIARKSIRESDLFDWEKVPNDVSQATVTSSTPPVGQFHTTTQEYREDPGNVCGSDRVSPPPEMVEENNDQENKREITPAHKGAQKANKLGTTDRGVIQKIREVLDAVEKENGKFVKPISSTNAKQVSTESELTGGVGRGGGETGAKVASSADALS